MTKTLALHAKRWIGAITSMMVHDDKAFLNNAFRVDDNQKNKDNVPKWYIKQPLEHSVTFFSAEFLCRRNLKNNLPPQLSSRDKKALTLNKSH